LDFESSAFGAPSEQHLPEAARVSIRRESVIGTGFVAGDRSSDAAADAAMDRYAAGDGDSFSTLYDLLAPRLYGFLLRQTRNASLAEDLVQQTMLQIHCARGRFIRGAPVTPWAFAIARRLLIDESRKNRLTNARAGPDGESAFERAESKDVPADEQLHNTELKRMIRRELDRLPPSQRAAFELVKEEGLTHAEAADVLGTTVMAIKLRAHRTYAALRAALGPAFDLGDV
jgi:RNA polymerase sigma-70 factor (ECF subfamily)